MKDACPDNTSSLFDFRRVLALGLLSYSEKARGKVWRNRRGFYTIPDTVRLTECGIHWVEFVETKGRCQVYAKNKFETRPNSRCSYCKVFFVLQ